MENIVESGPRVVAIAPEPLTPEAFSEFGSVVGPERLVLTSTEFPFFTNVATLQPDDGPITYLNRHHDHHQIFATFDGRPMIVVVASPRLGASELRPEAVSAFLTDGNTAIVFHVDTWHVAPRAVGPEPIRALNVQATNNQVHTERVELGPTFGWEVRLEVPRKEALVRRLRESRAKLEETVGRLSDARMARPGPDGWSAKDHLAHVAIWEESLLALLEGRDREAAMGLEPTPTWDLDAANAAIYERHRGLSLSTVRDLSQETHARVLAALARLTDADLLRPYAHYQPNDPPHNPKPVIGWIDGNTWEHYAEHARWIDAMMASPAAGD